MYVDGVKGLPSDWININKADYKVAFPKWGGILQFMPATHPDSIKGPNCGAMLFDEIGIIPKDSFLFAISRARHPDAINKQIICVGTPEGTASADAPKGWHYEVLVVGPQSKECSVYYGKTEENLQKNGGFLRNDYIDMLRSIYPEQMLASYLEGKFVPLASGRVVNLFDRTRHLKSGLKYRPGVPLWIGMDFNVIPMAATVSQYDGRVVRYLKSYEMRYFQDSVSPLDGLCQAIQKDFPQYATVFPDATGNNRDYRSTLTGFSIIRQYFGADSIRSPGKNPPVLRRIMTTNKMLEQNAIEIDKDNCHHIIKSFEGLTYVEGTQDIDKKSGFDHIFDAATYKLDYNFGKTRPETAKVVAWL